MFFIFSFKKKEMKTLDFKTACIIAGYKYKITDGENEYKIEVITNQTLVLTNSKLEHSKLVYFPEIGSKYWILARDFENIERKFIEHLVFWFGFNDNPRVLPYIIKNVRNGSIQTKVNEYLLENNFNINLDKKWCKPLK